MWHERTKELQQSGKLQVVGLIQEQHPGRCRLFMQWKKMKWPILVDSLNLLGVQGAPLIFLLDEHGVVRQKKPSPDGLEASLEKRYRRPADLPEPAAFPDPDARRKLVRDAAASPGAWMAHGDALFLRAQAATLSRGDAGPAAPRIHSDLDAAVRAYRKAIELDAPPQASFRLGVALRRRHETAARKPGDFQEALASWGRALAERPNQYIWRRRIQQYGPRLEKPYPFYDWVRQARSEIAARGEKPLELRVEPRGAEIAHPARVFRVAGAGPTEPDPQSRIRRDRGPLIRVESAVAPAVVRRGKSARVHLILRPDRGHKAHWNNEAGKLALWIKPPAAVEVDERLLEAENAKTEISEEARKLEFEVRVARDASPGALTVPAYALYYVCEDKEGICQYLRQDLELKLEVR